MLEMTMPNDTTPEKLARVLDLLDHPAVEELASILNEAEALGNRIVQFLEEHSHRCRCPLCRDLERRDLGFPEAKDVLVMIAGSCRAGFEGMRPRTKAEFTMLREELTEDMKAAKEE